MQRFDAIRQNSNGNLQSYSQHPLISINVEMSFDKYFSFSVKMMTNTAGFVRRKDIFLKQALQIYFHMQNWHKETDVITLKHTLGGQFSAAQSPQPRRREYYNTSAEQAASL